MNALYQILISCFVLGYLPIFFYEYIKKKKYKGRLRDKLGLRSYRFKKGAPTLWVHAVSVGEVKAVVKLLKQFKSDYPTCSIILSTVTETGQNEAKKSAPFVDHFVLMPIDLKASVKRLLKRTSPDLVLVVETDLWPNFLRACKKKGAKIILINGKVSERSFSRLKKVPFFYKWYYAPLDKLIVQDQEYKARFKELGVLEKKIQVAPNLKLDDEYLSLLPGELSEYQKKFNLTSMTLTLGSTHPGEEEALLKEIKPLLLKHSNLKVFLAPRHPDRNHEVELLLQKEKLSYARLSSAQDFSSAQIILVDTMGFLRTCYQLSNIALVAGSFSKKIGGHNILEPLWYGTPCLFGPYMRNQKQMQHLVTSHQAGEQVQLHELKKTLENWFASPDKLLKKGQRGKQIFTQAKGGTESTLHFLKKVLEEKPVSY